MEIPTDPQFGVNVAELEKILHQNSIKACLFIPNFHNPLGACMPDTHKQRLVERLYRFEIPIIEDDISSELFFGRNHPMPLKAFDKNDRVITCSSFSKTMAPGLRIGWVIPGKRYQERIQNLKAAVSVTSSTLDQYLVSEYLASGAYARHLRTLRNALKKQVVLTAFSIQKHFPSETRLAVPSGGTLLWVQLPPAVDGLKIYQEALDHNIAIIPGVVCSNSRQFKNYIQISCGAPFTEEVEDGIELLGQLVSKSC
jgi:DNA-binding transcriptional MocR family regulator